MAMLVQVSCAGCGIRVCAFPHIILEQLPRNARQALRAELAAYIDDEGRRFAIADEDGSVPCPDCGDQLVAA